MLTELVRLTKYKKKARNQGRKGETWEQGVRGGGEEKKEMHVLPARAKQVQRGLLEGEEEKGEEL